MKKIQLIFVLFCLPMLGLAQQISVRAQNKALNALLVELRDSYKLNLSFDDKALAAYSITLTKRFDTPYQAFQELVKDLPVVVEKANNVFLFYPAPTTKPKPRTYTFSCVFVDQENKESLPFTHLLINGRGYISDESGSFDITSKTDSVFTLRVSHLGYFRHDTTLVANQKHYLFLRAASVQLAELVVERSPVVFSSQTGSKAGLMRINHKVARLIPGNGDNSVFNILRLQPGILAAGENSNNMVIWGSYEGQSRVNFDGMTIFGLKNFNDNISTINPFIAKDIRVHKGAYGAQLGERVGGVVEVTGLEGNKKSPGLSLNLNNMTMNAMAESPIGDKLAVVAAYRQTYYNLYQPGDILLNNRQRAGDSDRITLTPDYLFRDGNLKITGRTNSGDSYQFSSFAGYDEFSYALEDDRLRSYLTRSVEEKNQQYGASAQYNKRWKGLGNSRLLVAYSNLERNAVFTQTNYRKRNSETTYASHESTINQVSELKLDIDNHFYFRPTHKTSFGLSFLQNSANFSEDTMGVNHIYRNNRLNQIVAYVQDEYQLNSTFKFGMGLRNNYLPYLKQSFLQPRVRVEAKLSEQLKLNAAWGIYNQFTSMLQVTDNQGNYRYQWVMSDGEKIPVLQAQHGVIGGSFRHEGFMANVEGFYKNTQGISRLVQTNNQRMGLFSGNAKALGLDVFVKQEYKGHSAWVAYTLSRSLEWFPFFEDDTYQRAFQDQLHEIKLATLFKIRSFYLSANYVYGSGFLQNLSADGEAEDYPYSRLDLALIYKFALKKVKLEAGISVLNVFDRENIKYNNYVRIPEYLEQTVGVHTESVPFTPALFLNLSF